MNLVSVFGINPNSYVNNCGIHLKESIQYFSMIPYTSKYRGFIPFYTATSDSWSKECYNLDIDFVCVAMESFRVFNFQCHLLRHGISRMNLTVLNCKITILTAFIDLIVLS